jgi:DNA-binding Lrp family transcriptional regulator
VNLSSPAVKRRVDRLRSNGVITGFGARVDPAALGQHTEAFVEVYCESNMSPTALRETLAGEPEIVAAYTVTGEADALVHLRATDVGHSRRPSSASGPIPRSRARRRSSC